eukprot:UC4_evm4s125
MSNRKRQRESEEVSPRNCISKCLSQDPTIGWAGDPLSSDSSLFSQGTSSINFSPGDLVLGFYQAKQCDGYFSPCSGPFDTYTPRINMTHGWVPATVIAPGKESKSNLVKIRYNHKHWVNRIGVMLDTREEGSLDEELQPSLIKAEHRISSLSSCSLTLFVIRWADPDIDPSKGFHGGWGDTGSVVSDRYIESWCSTITRSLSGDHEIVTAWVSSSEDLTRLGSSANSIKCRFRGRHCCSMWFLWPVAVQDGVMDAGYVGKAQMLGAMELFERAGVQTRFPHPSPLYRVLLEKEWCAQLCLDSKFCLPATTKVTAASVATDSMKAAQNALKALVGIKKAQKTMSKSLEIQGNVITDNTYNETVLRGVAKLGYSWQAMDVAGFEGQVELSQRMMCLLNQQQSTVASVFVQERVENAICEIRTFVVDGRPAYKFYTRFLPPDEDGSFCDFERLHERSRVLHEWFNGQENVLQDAEDQIDKLCLLWMQWLKTVIADDVPVIRIDCFVVPRAGAKNAPYCDIYTGELTELGASMLGWHDGPRYIYSAVLKSMFSDHKCQDKNCPCHNLDYFSDFVARAATKSVAVISAANFASQNSLEDESDGDLDEE